MVDFIYIYWIYEVQQWKRTLQNVKMCILYKCQPTSFIKGIILYEWAPFGAAAVYVSMNSQYNSWNTFLLLLCELKVSMYVFFLIFTFCILSLDTIQKNQIQETLDSI